MTGTIEHYHWPDKRIDLANLKPEDIDFGHIATGLSRIARYAGGTREPLSVAQHSMDVLDRVSAPAKAYALLHDAHEAYAGDVTESFRRLLGQCSGRPHVISAHWRAALNLIDRPIFAAAGLNPEMPDAILKEIVLADIDVRHREIDHAVRDVGTRPFRILSAEAARREFLTALRQLTGIIVV